MGQMAKESSEKSEQKNEHRKAKRSSDLEKEKLEPIPFLQLYRFTTFSDRLFLAFACLAAVFAGAGLPVLNIVFGNMSELIVNSKKVPRQCGNVTTTTPASTSTNASLNEDLVDRMQTYSIYLVIIGAVEFTSRFILVSLFHRVSEKMIFRLRQEYFNALLRQNVGWYDTVQNKSFVSKMSEDISKIQDATGEKAGLCALYAFQTLISLGISFYYGWLLTLVTLASAPVITAASMVISYSQSQLATKEQKVYGVSGGIAQEALSNIRTVMAFSGQDTEIQRYQSSLKPAHAAGRLRGLVTATGQGISWFLNYASFSLAFWYGSKLVFDSEETICEKPAEYATAELIIVFFQTLTAAFAIGTVLSYMDTFSVGRGAAAGIYRVVERTPEIDSYSDSGQNPSKKLTGTIEIRNVKFSYPARPEVQVLNGLSIQIKPGLKVALVGNSGCGKSTILQLLQRFYDPSAGQVCVDGVDIRDYNINWYRSQLGVVSQEPVLFNTTIRENIQFGREDVTDAEIQEACKLSNALGFIEQLPQKLDTVVGDRGAQLSGGQKQRIAIARALVRNPSILLLDEATSALDTQSEAVVQRALDRASEGRTTLIVAHRLSTIRTADVIISIDQGQVSEVGTHEELLAKKGVYYQLVTAQMYKTNPNASVPDENASLDDLLSEDVVEEAVPSEPAGSDHVNEISKKSSESVLWRLMKLNKPERLWIATGILFCMVYGSVLPVYAWLFADFMNVLSESDLVQARSDANTCAVRFLALGGFAGVTLFIAIYCFSVAGEALTNRLRNLSFKVMMQQDLSWYDHPANSVGALCSRLAGDAAGVQGATGLRLGLLVQATTTIFLAVGLSLYASPRLGGVAMAFVPWIIVASYFSGKMVEEQEGEEQAAKAESGKLAFQAVTNIRTVASLCKEKKFAEMYADSLVEPYRKGVKQSKILGLIFGLAPGLVDCAYAALFYYGAILIRDENEDYNKIFLVGEALVWSMLLIGQTLAFLPNYGKAKASGQKILTLLATRPKILDSKGVGLCIKVSTGSLQFDKVDFQYPTRQNTQILKGLNLGIEPNLSLGICGPSGSGKSTCIQLILRYYDPVSGKILLDETDTASLNVTSLRSQMALVAQEPALFDRTLRENIAYGDNSKEADMASIIQAAKSANIHDFISSLPAGYETRVGELGAQLSGGQKQRVAIARALIRNPRILLLDEATSALDTESEKIVQSALESAGEGRTCITIAHRLSSIQNVDRIIVISNGSLIEMGSHAELLAKHGLYYKLWHMQGQNT